MLSVEYIDDIIVATIHNGKFIWFVGDKDFWFLDFQKQNDAALESGFDDGMSIDDIAKSRYGIVVLDSDNFDDFLKFHHENITTKLELTRLLQNELPKKYLDEAAFILPSLFVDFDRKILYSYFYEAASFEDYVPNGWESKYIRFLDIIPKSERYWIVGENNYLDDLEE